MRIPRIYTAAELQISSEVLLDGNARKHVKEVLRLKRGDAVTLFNGGGFDYHGEVAEVSKKRVRVSIGGKTRIANESSLNIHLLQPLCRGDKMDWCLQKATELGVCEITPVISQRVNINIPQNRLTKKMQHWLAVTTSACEQSGRARIPVINPPLQLLPALECKEQEAMKIVASPNSRKKFPAAPVEITNCCVCLIGPEGGLTTEEMNLIETAGFTAVSLGPRILRLETAVTAMITLLQSRWGDLH